MQLIIRYYRILSANNEVLYIGATQNTVEQRFKQHLQWKRHADKTCHIEEIKSIDIGDIKTIEDYNEKRKIVAQIERDLIKEYKDKGCELTNISKGGEILSNVYNTICKEYFFKKYGTYCGFKEYKKKRDQYRNWLRNWIRYNTDNPAKRWLIGWINNTTEYPTKKWLRHWIANTTKNPTKRWLQVWINHATENPSKRWLNCWINNDTKNITKLWLSTWISHVSKDPMKVWLRHWIYHTIEKPIKIWLQHWVSHRIENPIKQWLHNWMIIDLKKHRK